MKTIIIMPKKGNTFQDQVVVKSFCEESIIARKNIFREPAAKSSISQPFRVSIILLQNRKPENCKSKRNTKGDFSGGGKKRKRQQRKKRNSRVAKIIQRIKREREMRKNGMRDRSSSSGRQRRSKKHRRQKARERRNKSRTRRSKRSLVSHNDLNEMLNELKCRRAERKRVQRERRQNLSEAGSETHYCTGTLLNDKWVITTASCFDVSLFLFRIFQNRPLS